jgi:hypothetical protein
MDKNRSRASSSRAFGSGEAVFPVGGAVGDEEYHDGNGDVWRNAASGVQGFVLGERKYS